MLQERVDIRKSLFDKGLGSKLIYLDRDCRIWSASSRIFVVQQSRLSEADAAHRRAAGDARTDRRGVSAARSMTSLSKAEQKAAGLAQDVIKAEQRTKLSADRAGRRRRAAARRSTVGGVVTPAQALAVVVPQRKPSRDRGHGVQSRYRLRSSRAEGRNQGRHIQLHALWAAAWAKCSACLATPSPATRPQDGPNDKPRGAETSTSEPKGQELQYAARVRSTARTMQVEGRSSSSSSPGMAVTVEIKTGSRRIISYLLSPLARYNQEMLRGEDKDHAAGRIRA